MIFALLFIISGVVGASTPPHRRLDPPERPTSVRFHDRIETLLEEIVLCEKAIEEGNMKIQKAKEREFKIKLTISRLTNVHLQNLRPILEYSDIGSLQRRLFLHIANHRDEIASKRGELLRLTLPLQEIPP